MCGRITWIWDGALKQWVKRFDLPPDMGAVLEKKRYNVPPASHLPVVVAGPAGPGLAVARWGFPIPARPNGVFNTRIETAAESPMWRSMLASGRCVFPVTGFYEWKREGRTRRPFYITRADGEPLLLAGLTGMRSVDGQAKRHGSIVTCAPNQAMAGLHDRMPVILEQADWAAWLQGDMDVALDLAVPAGDVLLMHEVGPAVNSSANDDPSLTQPARQSRLF